MKTAVMFYDNVTALTMVASLQIMIQSNSNKFIVGNGGGVMIRFLISLFAGMVGAIIIYAATSFYQSQETSGNSSVALFFWPWGDKETKPTSTLESKLPLGSLVAYSGPIFNPRIYKSYTEVAGGVTQNVYDKGVEKYEEVIKLGWMPADGTRCAVDDPQVGTLNLLYQFGWGGDPSTGPNFWFRLPDLRGVFVRGVVNPTDLTKDPDANSRTKLYSQETGSTGTMVGSYQDDGIKSHNHTYYTLQARSHKNTPGSRVGINANDPGTSQTTQVPANFRSDTRPKNVYVHWLVKVKDGPIDTAELKCDNSGKASELPAP